MRVAEAVYHLRKYVSGVRKLVLVLTMSVISMGMRVSSCITLHVLLENFTFNLMCSGLLKCLATGSPLLLS